MQEKTIENISRNSQATHNQVVVNSIAMAILKLLPNYYPVSFTNSIPIVKQEDLHKAYGECCQLLSELKPSSFFKIDETPDPLLLKQIEDNLVDTIHFIIAQMNDRLSILDNVSLYIDGREVRLQLPLYMVFPLVIKAYLDDGKFVHAYEGTSEERLDKARQDRPLRLLSIFQCLQRVRNGICHTGVRNELVSLLNGAYEGIHIIEDATATIEYFLKEKIFIYLQNAIINTRSLPKHPLASEIRHQAEALNLHPHEVHEDSSTALMPNLTASVEFPNRSTEPDSLDTRLILNALFTWMTTRNANFLLSILDKAHEIKAQLLDYFVAQGSNPKELSVIIDTKHILLPDAIELIAANILYPHDIVHHGLWVMIDKLLNASTDVLHHEARNKALDYVKVWIRTHVKLHSPPASIAGFYSVYQCHNQILQYKNMLILSNQITHEEIIQFLHDCDEYYQQQIRASDTETLINPTLSLHTQICNLQKAISLSKKDDLSDKITNFFSLWYVAKSESDINTLKQLYSLLLEPKALEKINLTDALIHRLTSNFSEENGQSIISITPYEINRIFLHAIINHPGSWSRAFADIFQTTLNFIQQPFPENQQLSHQLIEDSYPTELITQLNYLYAKHVHHNVAHERPSDMLVLPHNIKTANEWFYVSILLSNEKRLSIYRILKANIDNLLDTYITNTYKFSEAINSLPTSECNFFITSFIEKHPRKITENRMFITLNHEHHNMFCEAIIRNPRSIIKSTQDFQYVMFYMNEHRDAFYIACSDYLNELINTSNDFNIIMSLLTDAQRTVLYSNMIIPWNELIKTGQDFKEIFQYLNEEQRTEVYSFIKNLNCWAEIIRSGCDYEALVKYLNPQQTAYVNSNTVHRFHEITKTADDFRDLIISINIEQIPQFCISIIDRLHTIFKNGYNFYLAIRGLNSEIYAAIHTGFTGFWNKIIRTTQEFKCLLEYFNLEQRTSIFSELESRLPEFIKTSSDLGMCMQYLTPQQCNTLCTSLAGRLDNINKSLSDFMNIIERLNAQQCKTFCNFLGDKLAKIITPTLGFEIKIQNLSFETRDALYIAMQEYLPSIISGHSDFEALIQGAKFNERNYTIVYLAMEGHWHRIINSSYSFKVVMQNLKPIHRNALYTIMADSLYNFIDSEQSLTNIVLFLNEAQSTDLYLKIPHEQYIKLILNKACYDKILQQLPQNITLKNALDEALALREMLIKLEFLSNYDKTNQLLLALIENDLKKIHVKLKDIYNSVTNNVGTYKFFEERENRIREFNNAKSILGPYWKNKIAMATASVEQAATMSI